jgi:hypothetical protein
VQTCSKCNAQSPDNQSHCSKCGEDLSKYSTMNAALTQFQTNQRVKIIRLVVMEDACPACKLKAGTYQKDQVPYLPSHGCSQNTGCRCFYEPFLDEIYP